MAVNDWILGAYNVWRGLHILAVIAWMAGLLYLPRLFAYHTRADAGSQMDETFKIMERGLLNIIMRYAALATILFGGILIYVDGMTLGWDFLLKPAMLIKITGIVILFGFDGFLRTSARKFAANANTRPEKFWRMINDLPFLVAIIMVIAVTVFVRASG